jgi:ClpP class serine protease
MNGFDIRGGSLWAVRPDILGSIAAALREPGILAAPTRSEDLQAAAAASESKQEAGGIAVIPLRGVITPRASLMSLLFGGGEGLEGFRANLRAALASKDVSQILLDIDSPGGSTDLVSETAAEVRSARQTKPVTAVANTMAASAAYAIASQANELAVTPSGDVGSIGVFAVHEDWTGFNEKFGVEPTYISAGKFKTELNPDSP